MSSDKSNDCRFIPKALPASRLRNKTSPPPKGERNSPSPRHTLTPDEFFGLFEESSYNFLQCRVCNKRVFKFLPYLILHVSICSHSSCPSLLKDIRVRLALLKLLDEINDVSNNPSGLVPRYNCVFCEAVRHQPLAKVQQHIQSVHGESALTIFNSRVSNAKTFLGCVK